MSEYVWSRVAFWVITVLAFLGMVAVVEHIQLGFWRWALRNSEHCRISGCVCPCHDAKEEAEKELENSARRLGLRDDVAQKSHPRKYS